MIDEPFRQWLHRRWSAPVRLLQRVGVTPNQLTLTATALGLVAACLVMLHRPVAGISVWLAGRLLDGYDGMLARQSGRATLFGGYLDITLDMLVYAVMAVAFAVAMPADRMLWMVVLVGYVLAITTTLALSSLAERAHRQLGGDRSIQFTPALAEGGETSIVYVAVALVPMFSRWVLMAWIVVLALTAAQRTWLARRILRG